MRNPFEEYKINSKYGSRIDPISRKEIEFHAGIDLDKGYQQPIYAFYGGEVVFASEGLTGTGFGNYGNTVAIKDRKGRLHCYCHLYYIFVKVGDKVIKGTMIARQGGRKGDPGAGSSTGTHLHFEVRKASSPSYGWIKDKKNMCYEPTQYLLDLYKEDEKPQMSRIYKDVPVDNFYLKDLELLKEKGILVGHTDGTFRGDKPITRYEHAASLASLYREVMKNVK